MHLLILEFRLSLHYHSIAYKRVEHESSVAPVKSEDIVIDLTTSESPKSTEKHERWIIEILYSDDDNVGGNEMLEGVNLNFERRNADNGLGTCDDIKVIVALTDWLVE